MQVQGLELFLFLNKKYEKRGSGRFSGQVIGLNKSTGFQINISLTSLIVAVLNAKNQVARFGSRVESEFVGFFLRMKSYLKARLGYSMVKECPTGLGLQQGLEIP